MAADMALTLTDFGCFHGRRRVVSGVSIKPLVAGRLVALLGPNAAGKSSLLKGIAGLLRSEGRACLGETVLGAVSARRRATLLGFMPQGVPDGIELTVFESLVSTLEASGTGTVEARLQAARTLERCGILGLAMHKLNRLSGGQRQLVNFGQTIAGNPALLCLDEPTSALDPRHQIAVMALSRALARDSKVVLVVLHDLNLAARWADEILVLKDGTLYAQGTPEEVMTPAMLAEVYGVDGHAERSAAGHLLVYLGGG